MWNTETHCGWQYKHAFRSSILVCNAPPSHLKYIESIEQQFQMARKQQQGFPSFSKRKSEMSAVSNSKQNITFRYLDKRYSIQRRAKMLLQYFWRALLSISISRTQTHRRAILFQFATAFVKLFWSKTNPLIIWPQTRQKNRSRVTWCTVAYRQMLHSLQLFSSVLSLQSYCPSQIHAEGIQVPSPQRKEAGWQVVCRAAVRERERYRTGNATGSTGVLNVTRCQLATTSKAGTTRGNL